MVEAVGRRRVKFSDTSMAGSADLADKDFLSYPRERWLTLFSLLDSCMHNARAPLASLLEDGLHDEVN